MPQYGHMKDLRYLAGWRSVLLLDTCLLYLAICALIRVGLTLFAWTSVDLSPALVGAYAIGLGFDFLTGSYFVGILAIYLAVLPNRLLKWRWGKLLVVLGLLPMVLIWVFGGVAEIVFWEEFELRFNFIAVDYLVYTQEVVDNILQSYPVGWIFGGIGLVSSALVWLITRRSFVCAGGRRMESWPLRWATVLALIGLTSIAEWGIALHQIPHFANNYHKELAKNGTYSLFSAFWNNELPYSEFYPQLSEAELDETVRLELAHPFHQFLSDAPGDWRRQFNQNAQELQLNVIVITVESLSASFLGNWGGEQGVTPHLDRLVEEGTVFNHLYATGTRTVRGLESLTTLLPPTPGRSLVKRPYGHKVPTIASEFSRRNYDMTFLYGGNGFFDNMNRYFDAQGYRVIDRPQKPDDAVSFENAWGACDEDLFAWAMEEANASHAAGRPFHQFIMTTSNHRPYTYPDGKVAIPSGTGRLGAVAYTDYAIGQFIERARVKPWFNETLFLIVADHCANSAGKVELDHNGYRIPAILYCPKHVAAGKIDTLASQVDVMPTVLGVMGWQFVGNHFGRDARASADLPGRAYIGNYQKLGYLSDNELVVLSPLGQPHAYLVDLGRDAEPVAQALSEQSRATVIAVYQGADRLIGPYKGKE